MCCLLVDSYSLFPYEVYVPFIIAFIFPTPMLDLCAISTVFHTLIHLEGEFIHLLTVWPFAPVVQGHSLSSDFYPIRTRDPDSTKPSYCLPRSVGSSRQAMQALTYLFTIPPCTEESYHNPTHKPCLSGACAVET